MKLIILPYSATPNPLGFPGEYPAERKQVDDKYELQPGEIEVTEEEWRRRYETHYATVAALIDATEVAKKTAEQAKQIEVDGFFSDLEALLATIESTGKLDAAEQTQFNIRLIKILLAREQTKL